MTNNNFAFYCCIETAMFPRSYVQTIHERNYIIIFIIYVIDSFLLHAFVETIENDCLEF